MKYTPLLIALLFPCSLIAQNEAEEKPKIKRQSKIIIRTADGENEIAIDDLDSNPEALEKLIESGDLPEHVREMLKDPWSKIKLSVPIAEELKKGIIIDAFGDKHEIDFDRDFGGSGLSMNSLNLFGDKKDAGFDKLWPQIAKGLERAGIDTEAIERAHDYAEAYASPNKKHMIGVQCREIGDVLRHQLGLQHGIVVQEVFKDSPAKEAGIQKHDIILQADTAPLEKVTDLVDAVQAAGLEKAEIKLTVLRGGENHEISMKPQKRKSPKLKELHIMENDAFGDARKSLTDELQEEIELKVKSSLERF